MIKLFSASKLVLSLLLLTSIFIACESNNDDVAQLPLLKERIGADVDGKVQLSINADLQPTWEKVLEKNGYANVQLQDFELISEEDNTMLLVANSTDQRLSLSIEVVKENGTYYLLTSRGSICVGDPGCDFGCEKYKHWVSKTRYRWICRSKCNNGVDCVSTVILGGGPLIID